MEFNEKLQLLRKQNNMTQEQLAEKLYVSRTAVSKWESGKGYPNIESLKSISRLFSVTIDDLLSGEELISLAADENLANINKFYTLIYAILDLMMLVFLFLPLYGQEKEGMIRMVNALTWTIYFIFPILMAIMGIVQLIASYFSYEKGTRIMRNCSVFLQAFSIIVFTATRQPYATVLLFLFFMIKVILLIKSSKLN